VKLLNRHPERRQLGELVPVHEVGDTRRRLNLGALGIGCFELEEHRDAVAAEPEEHALAEAQDAAVAPAEHETDRDEGVSEVLADQIETKDVERERQDE